MHVPSWSIASIRNSIQKNIKSFKTIEANQFTQLWAVSQHDFKNLYLYLLNIWKNKFFTDNILETKKDFNILFIQELL